jgi:hypothetical protein
MLSAKGNQLGHPLNDQMHSPRNDSKVGSVTSSKRLYHVVETDGTDGDGTYDIAMKEIAEDVDLNRKQKAMFGMAASEIRMSINEEMPLNMGNDGFEDEEDVNDTGETKERQETFKK